MFIKLVHLGPHCTGTPAPDHPPFPDTLKLFTMEPVLSAKLAVGIRLKCFLLLNIPKSEEITSSEVILLIQFQGPMNLCYSIAKAAQGAYSKVLALGNFYKKNKCHIAYKIISPTHNAS